MKLRVLFVDDEQNILNGLRRTLQKQRGVWDMSFAESGDEALEELGKTHFDVVVSDMRMPGMNGAELLDTVRHRYPNTLRIILSGYSEDEAILRTVGPAHQYLAKPCDPKTLIESVDRGITLQHFIGKKEVRNMISGLGSLPTPPSVLFNLLKEIESPQASATSISNIISGDIALSAQVMRLTNSAFFSLPNKATTPLQAVSLLGFDTIRAVVLSTGIFGCFEVSIPIEAAFSRLSVNCMTIGAVAWALAKAEGLDDITASHAQCAGILSHLGSLLLMAYRPDSFQKACNVCETKSITIYEAERELYDVGHGELGAYLLGLWGFADPIIEAVAYHHMPGKAGSADLRALTFVHAAQSMCSNWNERSKLAKPTPYRLDEEYLQCVGVSGRMEKWNKIGETFRKKEMSHE